MHGGRYCIDAHPSTVTWVVYDLSAIIHLWFFFCLHSIILLLYGILLFMAMIKLYLGAFIIYNIMHDHCQELECTTQKVGKPK
jgi:hypothetical protein